MEEDVQRAWGVTTIAQGAGARIKSTAADE